MTIFNSCVNVYQRVWVSYSYLIYPIVKKKSPEVTISLGNRYKGIDFFMVMEWILSRDFVRERVEQKFRPREDKNHPILGRSNLILTLGPIAVYNTNMYGICLQGDVNVGL